MPGLPGNFMSSRPKMICSRPNATAHGIINKTFSVTHLNVYQAQNRYSIAAVIAVEREAVYIIRT
jgi:hypothetical protein